MLRTIVAKSPWFPPFFRPIHTVFRVNVRSRTAASMLLKSLPYIAQRIRWLCETGQQCFKVAFLWFIWDCFCLTTPNELPEITTGERPKCRISPQRNQRLLIWSGLLFKANRSLPVNAREYCLYLPFFCVSQCCAHRLKPTPQANRKSKPYKTTHILATTSS